MDVEWIAALGSAGGALFTAVGAVLGARWRARRAALERDTEIAPDLVADLRVEVRGYRAEVASLRSAVDECERRSAAQAEGHGRELAEAAADRARCAETERQLRILQREVRQIARAGGEQRDTPPTSSGRVVLVVDDDERVRVGLARQVGTIGYRALMAGSAPEALAWIAAEPVDVALVDQRMPGLQGDQLIKQIRELGRERGRRVACLLVTGDPEHAPVIGAPVLAKGTLTTDQLASAIAGALEDTDQHVLPGRK